MYGLSGRELRFALLVSSSHFAQHVYYRILPPLIPVLSVALEYPLWQLGLLITLTWIGMGITQAPLGVLSDRIDRRYLLPTGLALTGAAYVVFAAAPYLGTPLPSLTIAGYIFEGGFLVMALSMGIVGIGLAVVHPAGYPMITDNVAAANKGKALGIFGASSKLGDAATPAFVAVLILALAWEQIVLLFGVAGVLYGIALYAVLGGDEYVTIPSGRRETPARRVDEDQAGDERARGRASEDRTSEGQASDDRASGDHASDDRASEDHASDDRASGDHASDDRAGEDRVAGRRPTERQEGDRRSFLYPMVAVYCYFISISLSTMALNTFLPVFLVAVYAYSIDVMGVHVGAESVANVYFALLLFSGAVMQLVLGGLTDRFDTRLILIYCMGIAAAGMFMLAVFDLHPLLLAVVIVVLGAGMYGVNPARDALISDLSPPAFEGRAFGYIFTAVTLTTAPLPTVIGYLLDTVGMREGYLLLAVGPVLAGACITTLYSDRIYRQQRSVAAYGDD